MAKQKIDPALEYHANGRPGKIEVIPTKPHSTQRDLSLAYSPGVAVPCKSIQKDPGDAYKYTAKGNLVAVISNGTAVLGLGDIGPLAGKPVMEGKGLLFKIFADVDVFDIEVDEKNIDKFIETVKAISPTFGGINLEDIKAPECFEIEQRLIEALDIPVFHDDQHGTAIISAAGLKNALEINGKNINDIKVVVNGAGASAVSCVKLYIALGVKPGNVVMVDSKGVINRKRENLSEIKKQFVTDREIYTLKEAFVDADVFLGLSVGNLVTREMVQSMAPDPIVFAMANPDPEISYEEAMNSRDDIIFATGRSDHPNQINNVLGFPFIFRGALDVRASTINEEMKLAAVNALADLAKEDVPESVNLAYNQTNIRFGREYIIPKPLDPRLINRISSAVSKAAMDSGVAQKPIDDWDAYSLQLMKRMGTDNSLIRGVNAKARTNPKRVLYGQAANLNVLKAVQSVKNEGLAFPMLLGNRKVIQDRIVEHGLDLLDVPVIDLNCYTESSRVDRYARHYVEKRKRKGVIYEEALELMRQESYYGSMMVELGEADAFLSGTSSKYANVIKPALQVIGVREELSHIAGMYILFTKKGVFFFADTTVNRTPDAQTLVDTTLLAAEEIRKFNIVPKIAMVSYSNFGNVRDGSPGTVTEAVRILHRDYPDLIVDGEMQANVALNRDLRNEKYPFTKLAEHDVNTLIFPNLSSGNISYKMMQEIGGAEVIGPILMGMKKPVHILQMESSVREIVYLTAISVVDAQNIEASFQNPKI